MTEYDDLLRSLLVERFRPPPSSPTTRARATETLADDATRQRRKRTRRADVGPHSLTPKEQPR